MALWLGGDVALAGLTPEASCPVQGKGARQSEQLGSWRCDETPRVKDCFV